MLHQHNHKLGLLSSVKFNNVTNTPPAGTAVVIHIPSLPFGLSYPLSSNYIKIYRITISCKRQEITELIKPVHFPQTST